MPRLNPEYIKTYGKLEFTRQEIQDKLGFDLDDQFYVAVTGHGRDKVLEFTLFHGAAEKYAPKPEPAVESKPQPRRRWWERKP